MTAADWAGLEATPWEIEAAEQAAAEVARLSGDVIADWNADGTPELGTPEQATARELASHYREAGDYAEAAGLYEFADGPQPRPQAFELATTAIGQALDRAMHASAGRAQAIADQNATPAMRRRSGSSPTDDRLAIALASIAGGTYDAGRHIELASPTEAGRALAQARWNQPDPAAQVTAGMPCGDAIDDFGRCASPYHDMGCSSLADPAVVTPELRAAMADKVSRPLSDSRGHPWRDQHDQGMGLAAHVEAASGQRTRREGLFETGGPRPELPQVQRVMRIGDFDDPDDHGSSLSSAQASARYLAVQLGLASRTADQIRQEGIERAAQAAVTRGGRRPNHEDAFDVRARREERRRATQPVQAGDEPVHGSLPVYQAGQL